MKITTKVKRINAKLEKLELELEKIQNEECTHPNVVKVNNGSTGNYDREDSFWRECTCPDCDKFWTEEQ